MKTRFIAVHAKQAFQWQYIPILENLRRNRRLADHSRLLFQSCSAINPNLISPAGDEVALFSAARRSAKPGTNAFISPRSFGSGCAGLGNMPAESQFR